MGSVRKTRGYQLIRPDASRFCYALNTAFGVRFLALPSFEQFLVAFKNRSGHCPQMN